MQTSPSPRVLYVEDEAVVRRIITRAFERVGMEVRTAADGSEGVALAVDWRPDLILMDLMMPVMDGFEATRVIRSDTRTHDIPIVAYSASPLGSATRRAFEAGVDAFLSKFASHKELISTVRERLQIPS
jgi:two-component system cell cycle response regulator DivK